MTFRLLTLPIQGTGKDEKFLTTIAEKAASLWLMLKDSMALWKPHVTDHVWGNRAARYHTPISGRESVLISPTSSISTAVFVY